MSWLCDPMDCSQLGSSVHGILQARILESVTISSSRGSSWPRDQTQVSCVSYIGRQILYYWATWESHGGFMGPPFNGWRNWLREVSGLPRSHSQMAELGLGTSKIINGTSASNPSLSSLSLINPANLQSHHFMVNRWGNSGNSGWLYFSGLQNHCRWWLQLWN